MSTPPIGSEELCEVFRAHERPESEFLIGAENEKFGVHEETAEPLAYGGDFSVCQVLRSLELNHGWQPVTETEGGPVLGLKRGRASITLEPCAQLELSGEPLSDLHQVESESLQHLEEIRPVSEEMGIAWLTTGFHPLAKLEDLTWVPKQRYPIMREYLPTQGSGGLNMMQRTATVQGNFDWSSEADAMRKLQVALKLSPLLQAWFSNAPFMEGGKAPLLSMRGDVWTKMDPSRSGLIGPLWDVSEPTYLDYVEWSLDAGMFLIRRDGEIVRNTGQSFRKFMREGFQGHRATVADFELHLTTLFPEVRLKNTLEVRSVDGLPPSLALASLAVWTGVLYDQEALLKTQQLLKEWTLESVQTARDGLIARGLHAPLAGATGFDWAERVFEIAKSGLERRGRLDQSGASEARLLEPAGAILESRTLPAEACLSRLEAGGTLISATRTIL